MGMSVQDQLGPDLAEWFGVPGGKGVVITDVMDGGPAARAGLRPGDVVVSFEGDPVGESYRLRWLTANAGPGRTVRMGVWRERKLRTVAVALAEKPGETAVERPVRVAAGRKDQEPFGLSIEEQPGRTGLRVSSVDLRSTAYRAGLREGDVVVDVDGQPVHDRAAFRRAVAGGGAVTRLYVKRNGRSIFFGLRRDPAETAEVRSP
jgi:S1-C subfamily serine protease